MWLSTWFAGIWPRLAGWLLAIGAACLWVITLLGSAKRRGRAEVIAQSNEETLEAVRESHAIENDIARADDAERKLLRAKWTRKRS
jgi:hypothetical protein